MSAALPSVALEDGKYHFTLLHDSRLYCLRNGQQWREFLGDKAVHALFDHAVELQEKLKAAQTAEKHPPPGYIIAGWLRRGREFIGIPEHRREGDEPVYSRAKR